MRLNDLSENIYFDELEDGANPNIKLFVSSILAFPNLMIEPANFKAKIYTSSNLAIQMTTYFWHSGVKLSRKDFVKLDSNVPLDLHNHKGELMQVVMFESEDINKNVMFMFRKASKTTHVYAGVCRELRCFIFNSIFVDWIRDGVCKLYVEVSRALTNDRDYRELETSIDKIENILSKNPKMIILNVPKLGYETLIYRLAQRLRARISIGGIMSAIFQTLKKSQYFVQNKKDAKVLVVHKSHTLQEMKTANKTQNCVFVQITDKTRGIYENFGFYELGWSPLPSSFELQLLASVLHPDLIYAIHHSSYDTRMPPQLPNYLLKMCNHYAQLLEELQQAKHKELKALEDISSFNSTDNSTITSHMESMGCMKLTQDVSMCEDRQKRVQDWLAGEQGNDDREAGVDKNMKQKSKAINKNDTKDLKNAKPNKSSSSITKSLSRAQQKEPQDTQALTKAELFRIHRGSLKYLEDSDSN